MDSQLIPSPELSPPSVKHLSLAKKIELWAEHWESCEALLLAGLRSRIGPGGDLQAAYRDWHGKQMKRRECDQIAFLKNLSWRESRNGD